MRLFCFPHAGGGVIGFRSWSASLPAHVQLCSVLLPGREVRRSESPFTQFDPLVGAMVEQLRPWLDLPYAVFGHSMGSLLAFEWVRGIESRAQRMPTHLFLSGRAAPDLPPAANLLHSLPDNEFLEQLTQRYQGIPEEVVSNSDFLEAFLPVLRADIAVVESYRFKAGDPLDCPITAFSGTEDRSVTWKQLLGWKRQTRRQFSIQLLPGGHFYPQQPLLQTISSTLAQTR